jgi:hypothetical protein
MGRRGSHGKDQEALSQTDRNRQANHGHHAWVGEDLMGKIKRLSVRQLETVKPTAIIMHG